jgi:CcmD family protein
MDPTNVKFLFIGYTAAWIIVLVFVIILVRRGQKLAGELKRLRTLVENKEQN